MTIDRTDCRSLRTGFLRNAAERPNHTAVVVQDRPLTYAELEERARTLAGAILERLGGRASRVGVFAYRSEVTYSGILASLFAGATYVPLNARFPVERTRTMIRRAALDAIIADRPAAMQLSDVLSGLDATPMIVAPEDGSELVGVPRQRRCDASEVRSSTPARDLPPLVPDDIAYLLFTSGTTGEPKGVAVSHANVLHLLDVLLSDLEYTPEDRVSQHFDHTFDVSAFDLFAAWEAGGCVCVPQATELLAPGVFVNAHQLTVWFSVPSLVAQMRRTGQLRPGSLPSLRLAMFAGEGMPRPTMEAWQAAAVNARAINMYGPTETTIVCSGHEWDPHHSPAACVNGLVPIGKMFPGVGALVMGEEGKPVPPGEPGELCISGPLTCPGYWRDPERTADRFVSLLIDEHEARRFYRTGDRVLRQATGDYVFLGRVDHQIKVRGYRIELGEIEAVLMQQSGVTSAAAIGWPLDDGRPEGIVAFASDRRIDPAALMAVLRQRLPAYMVPSEVVALDALPLNANGKIDRGQLKASLEQRTRDAQRR